MSNLLNHENTKSSLDALQKFLKQYAFNGIPHEAYVIVSRNAKPFFRNIMIVDISNEGQNLICKISESPKYNYYPDGCPSNYSIANSQFIFVGNKTLLINSKDV